MKRKIIAFQQDEQGDWAVEMECGHRQHIRHKPPWINHPWVVTEDGRQQWIGKEMDCKECGTTEQSGNLIDRKNIARLS